ncbi:MAG: hypothetical protein CVT48_04520 [Thermoplasmata archaeon HGW-Thermoplasmata-1]|nr:MAG: hypothetical protein CVT48_04520 [Thermoplasmata archaeon HGW-Thermoplasmata-1]
MQSFNSNDEGVVGIVSAILLVSLFFIVMTVVAVEYVPAWGEAREAEHMDMVANQFSTLASTIEAQILLGGGETLTSPLKLGSSPLWFIQSAPAWGTLELKPDQFGIAVDSSSVILRQYGGSDYASIVPGTFKPLPPAGGEENNITKISYFMLKMNVSDSKDGMITTTVRDADGNPVGYVEVNATKAASNTYIILRSVNADGEELCRQPVATVGITEGLNNFYVDLLTPVYRFTEILATAKPPFDITLQLSGDKITSASYALAYTTYNEAANTTEDVGVGGVEKTDFNMSYACGTLAYSSQNAYFVNQNYIYDGCGVVVEQLDSGSSGNIFFQSPAVSLAKTGDKAKMVIRVVNLTSGGGTTSMTGTGVTSVDTGGRTSEKTWFATHELNITISTAYAEAWNTLFDRLFKENGYVKGIDYNITQSEGGIAVNFKGSNSGAERDIEFRMTYAVVETRVGSVG